MEKVFYILIVIVACLIGLVVLWALFIQAMNNHNQRKLRRRNIDLPTNGGQLARTMLDTEGLVNVEVVKRGFWGSIFLGNIYTSSKKEIRLKRRIYEKNKADCLVTICQLVGLAKLDSENDKSVKFMDKLRFLNLGTWLFVPVILLGIILDAVMHFGGFTITIVFTIVGFVGFFLSFIYALFSAKAISKASTTASKLITDLNILEEKDLAIITKSLKKAKNIYIATVILSTLYIIYYLLKILLILTNKK